MQQIAQHKVLAAGDSFETCCRQVSRFFDLTSLVKYDTIRVVDDQCRSGGDADFFDLLTRAEQKNRVRVASLAAELEQTGARTVADLKTLEHGYPSKVLHVLTHFLDGFIGIDSFFYNLPDDSHWVSRERADHIRANSAHYWLIHIDCYSASPEEASLLRM